MAAPATARKRPARKAKPGKGGKAVAKPRGTKAGTKRPPGVKGSKEQKALEADGFCAAVRKQDPSTAEKPPYCTKTAGWGTQHPGTGRCRLHGGNTASGVAYAGRELAADAVRNYGLPVDIDPHTALVEELQRSAGHVAFLHAKVQSLPEAEMEGPVGGAQGGIPEHKPSVWIQMYNAERKHCAEIAAVCIKAGIEERKVRVAEQMGQVFAEAIRGILTDLDVIDHPKAGEVVRKHLVGLQGGQAA